MSRPIRRISGIRAPELIAGLSLLLLASCNYSFQAGSGFPPNVRTLAVVPFANETERFELTQEVHALLLESLPRTFGLRTGGEDVSDAVVRGVVRRYSVEAPSYRVGAGGERTEVIERQVQVVVEVQVIDRINNLVLWENTGLTGRGAYLEDTQDEEVGRRIALERVLQGIVDGLQSNW